MSLVDKLFEVFKARDSSWKIKFDASLGSLVCRGSAYLSFEDEEEAKRIAAIVAREAKKNSFNYSLPSLPSAQPEENMPLFG